MKLLIFLLTLFSLSSKEFTVNLIDCKDDSLSVTYIDHDNDAVFDSLVINDCGLLLKKPLSPEMTVGKPNLEDYTNATFEVRLVNYNDLRNDAYFQVRLINQDTIYGYWEHVMGSYKLEWK